MYALSAPIAVAAFILLRGTEFNWWILWAFPVVATIYTVLVWFSRADQIGTHILGSAVVFLTSAALGVALSPHDDGLGLLVMSLLLAGLVLGVIAVGAIAYFAGWLSRLVSGFVSHSRKPEIDG